jgi:hypothetical protein
VRLLGYPFHHPDDEVLLENLIISKSLVAGFKDMEMGKICMANEVATERQKVRAVTEATGSDGDELSPLLQKERSEGDKSRIEIACFYAESVEKGSAYRIAT